jgi:hypothetical protein
VPLSSKQMRLEFCWLAESEIFQERSLAHVIRSGRRSWSDRRFFARIDKALTPQRCTRYPGLAESCAGFLPVRACRQDAGATRLELDRRLPFSSFRARPAYASETGVHLFYRERQINKWRGPAKRKLFGGGGDARVNLQPHVFRYAALGTVAVIVSVSLVGVILRVAPA